MAMRNERVWRVVDAKTGRKVWRIGQGKTARYRVGSPAKHIVHYPNGTSMDFTNGSPVTIYSDERRDERVREIEEKLGRSVRLVEETTQVFDIHI